MLKLLSGLELRLSEDGKAYTVPSRTEIAEVQQTFDEVQAWLRANRPSERQLARKRRLDPDVWHYADVLYWLGVFEDQYSYLSGNMPERQKREVSKGIDQRNYQPTIRRA